MTDETTDAPADESGAAGTSVATAEPEPTAPATVEHSAIEPVPFWQRPHVERYLAPLITPIIVVLALVIYVLNLSRIFLSAHGHTAVVVGSILTVVILLGATMFSNATRVRSQTIALGTAIFLLVIFSSGWLVLGHAQEKNASNAASGLPGNYTGTIDITAGVSGKLAFAPSSLSVKTGIYLVTLTDGANTQHTLNFDQTDTLWGSGLVVNNAGEKLQSRIFFGTPGTYTFYCAVTGHRAAGMQGTITVTGPTLTVVQATAAAKNTAKAGQKA